MSPEAKKEKPEEITTAEFDPNEIDALHDLYMWNWADNYVFVPPLRPNIGGRESERIFVAKKKDRMVGSIFYRPQEDHVYFLYLVVKRDYREHGVAQELIRFVEEQAARDDFPRVTVKAMNDQLAKYYERLGFRRIQGVENWLEKDIRKVKPQQS